MSSTIVGVLNEIHLVKPSNSSVFYVRRLLDNMILGNASLIGNYSGSLCHWLICEGVFYTVKHNKSLCLSKSSVSNVNNYA